ncbi:lipocalin-like domain-containing protein [Aquimarina agarilytica]|uniref:lipocalin family protein n=1 Tax=Aquimarina agarilytica TaxID=1087449 RepID=UPI00028827D8|nr:lipocalin family protein [Aquimarina agarilytica]
MKNFRIVLLFIGVLMFFNLTSCDNDDDNNIVAVDPEEIIGKWKLVGVSKDGVDKELSPTSCAAKEFYTFSEKGYMLERFKSRLKIIHILPCKKNNFSGSYEIMDDKITFDLGKESERKLKISVVSGKLNLTLERPLTKRERREERIVNDFVFSLIPLGSLIKPKKGRDKTVINTVYERVPL